jgi:glutamate/tyrosine decarboxylase-like PLP-dependent enzyme
LSEVRTKASGVEYADSITVDPHKLGYLPYPCSAIIFRRKSDLDAIAIEAPYIGPCANTIEGSRPGTGAAGLWVAQQTLGVSGYNRIISNCIELTKGLADRLREEGFQILHEIDLNTVCFSIFGDGIPRKKLNKSTNMLHTRVVSDGRFLLGKVEDISGVMVKDKPWQPDSERVGLTAIKAWIMDPNTRDSDIESLVDELLRRKREIS